MIAGTGTLNQLLQENVLEVRNVKKLRSYFLLEPASCSFDPESGRAQWNNSNPNIKQLKETFKVSPETMRRVLKGFELV